MKTVNSDSTKAEEIQHLKDLAATCKPGSYLADLFTPAFIAHIETLIRNDWPPDILGELQEEINRDIKKDSQHLDEIRRATHEIKKLNDGIATINDELDKARQATRIAQAENRSTTASWQNALQERLKDQATIAELNREIERLSARASVMI